MIHRLLIGLVHRGLLIHGRLLIPSRDLVVNRRLRGSRRLRRADNRAALRAVRRAVGNVRMTLRTGSHKEFLLCISIYVHPHGANSVKGNTGMLRRIQKPRITSITIL